MVGENVRKRTKVEDVGKGEDRLASSVQEDEEGEETGGQGWPAFAVSLMLAPVILAVVLTFLPAPIQPVAYSLPDPPALVGPLAPNEVLTKAERLFEGQIQGPESLVSDGDYLYTGTGDGKIVVIHQGSMRVLARLGKEPCGLPENEPTCGRPLGMRMNKDGYLIVADAYLGLFKVNVATGDVFTLYSSTVPINGKVPKFLNDLDIAPDGKIYVSDSSTKWDRRHNRYCILEAEDSGRLLEYNPETEEMREVVSGFRFLNGVQVSAKGDYLLLVETATAKIYKYHLEGELKGTLEVFAENLPGVPDNIRSSRRGTYYVGMATVRHAGKFSLLDFAAPRPWLRTFITKLLSQESLMNFVPKYGLLVEIAKNGSIVGSYHDPSGQHVPAISEAESHDLKVYLGSYNLPYLSRFTLKRG